MKIKKTCLIPFFIVLFLIGNILNVGIIKVKAEGTKVINLKDKLIPLKTTKAGNGYEDLDKLQVILKDKKIVAMGEATHGTKEFFQMKDRMFEFLVEKMGYRLFGIEANFDSTQVVNDYIINGTGNANDSVKSLGLLVYETEEVVNMVEWLRNYNKNPEHKSKVKFYGFDIQSAHYNGNRILDYIKKVDNNNLSEFERILLDVDNNRIDSSSKDMLNNIKNNTKELKNLFDKNKRNYIEKSSISEYEMAYQELNVDIQFIDYKIIQKDTASVNMTNMRDYYMAQNVKWILDYEKQFGNDKIMLWAHNGHVTKKMPNYTSMGENLKKIFNDKLYVIGFDFYQGSFRAIPCDSKGNYLSQKFAIFNVDKSDINSFAYNFEKTGIPLSFIDFKSASEDKNVAVWLSQTQLFHCIAEAYNSSFKQNLLPQVPIDSYDGLIFVKKTSATIGIKGNETSINDGDSFIKSPNRNIYIATIASIIIIILAISAFIYRKIKSKNNI